MTSLPPMRRPAAARVLATAAAACALLPSAAAQDVDCVMSGWSYWSDCTGACGGGAGMQNRVRIVMIQPQGAGAACPPALSEDQACTNDAVCGVPPPPPPPPGDCVMTGWGPWSACVGDCMTGVGQRTRTRDIIQTGAMACPATVENEACMVPPCVGPPMANDKDCVVTGWTITTACNAVCPTTTGTQDRERFVFTPATGAGAACPALTETIACTVTCAPVPPTTPAPPAPVCAYSGWQPWSACSVTCGAGMRTRTRVVTFNPTPATPCPDPLAETEACTMPDCPTPAPPPVLTCDLSGWSAWSGCTLQDCGVMSDEKRTRVVLFNGTMLATCQDEEETRACPVMACTPAPMAPTVVCPGYTGWSAWAACSLPCGGGSQMRTRSLLVSSGPGVNLCTAALNETQSCNVQACPPADVDCVMGSWVTTGICSMECCETAGCGGGWERSVRAIVTPATGMGTPCTATEKIITGCNNQTCAAVDCVVTAFGAWGDCDVTCNGPGNQWRSRNITTQPKYGGAACPALGERRDCVPAVPACSSNCTYGIWSGGPTPGTSGWSPCSAQCGGGFTFRQQQFWTDGSGPAATCDFCDGSLPNTVAVTSMGSWWQWNTKYDPYNSNTWAPLWDGWLGARFMATNGTFCIQNETCNAAPCADVDCVVSDWTGWTECSQKCKFATRTPAGTWTYGPPGTRTKTRYVIIPQQANGTACGDMSITEECNNVPCNVDCIPSEWSEWSACTGTCWDPGLTAPRPVRNRTRRIVVEKQFNGKECGPLVEESFCDVPACNQPCVLGDWSAWSQCDKVCGGGTRNRKRPVLFPAIQNGVEVPCNLPMLEEQPCNTVACRAGDCEVGPWRAWGPCRDEQGREVACATALVPGGTTMRERTVTVFPSPTGLPCPVLNETKPCNTKACARDCVQGAWTEWSACSVPCGGGSSTRTRQGDVQPTSGGLPCPAAVTETLPCGIEPCRPEDCTMSAWTDWSVCSAQCGGGVQERTRTVTKQSPIPGTACPATRDWRMCNTNLCPRDCEIGGWGDWSECSAACGGGKRESLAFVLQEAVAGGKECASTRREEDCNAQPCAVGVCVTSGWSEWSVCTRPCEGGVQTRTRGVTSPPASQGTCPALEEMRSCNLQPCPVDCVVAEWSGWDLCSHACGAGMRRRWRPVLLNASGAGVPCPAPFELELCNNGPCPPADPSPPARCLLSPFDEWGTCSASCGGGVQTRSRTVAVAAGAGTPCPTELTTEKDCNVHGCPVACEVTPFSDWTLCSAPCGGGVQVRRRWVTVAPAGGAPCPHAEESRACGAQPCAAGACRVSAWTEWGACSAPCGAAGVATRTRTVVAAAAAGGAACPVLTETAPCNRGACDEDCVVSDWQAWTQCSAVCGGGTRTRERWVVRERRGAGKVCPVLVQRRPCREDELCTAGACSAAAWSAWPACPAAACGEKVTRQRTLPADGSCKGEPTEDEKLCGGAGCGGGGGTPAPGSGGGAARSEARLLPLGNVALCSALLLDGSLSRVRSGDSVTWSTPSGSLELQRALTAAGGQLTPTLDLPTVLAADGEGSYLICLRVGAAEKSCQAVGVFRTTRSLNVLMEGGSRRDILESDSLHLHVHAQWTPCAGGNSGGVSGPSADDGSLTFKWLGFEPSTTTVLTSLGRSLVHPAVHLPGGTLSPGVHMIRAEVCGDPTPQNPNGDCRAAAVEVTVRAPPLRPIINRNDGTVTMANLAEGGVTLDATPSSDPSSAKRAELHYKWACEGLAAATASCPPGFPTDYSLSPIYTLPASMQPGSYAFTLTLKSGDRTASSDPVTITVLPRDSEVIPLTLGCRGHAAGALVEGIGGGGAGCIGAHVFDPAYKLALVATVTDGGEVPEYTWEVDGEPDMRFSTEVGGGHAVLAANTLALGRTYTVRLRGVRGLATSGEATLVVKTLPGPTRGTCEISPKTGTELTTKFDIACTGWSCPGSPNPPSFRFEAEGTGPLGYGYRELPHLTSVLLRANSVGNVNVRAFVRCGGEGAAVYGGGGAADMSAAVSALLAGDVGDAAGIRTQLYAAARQGRIQDALRYLNLVAGSPHLDGSFDARNVTETFLSLRQAEDTPEEATDAVRAAFLLSRRFAAAGEDATRRVLQKVRSVAAAAAAALANADPRDDVTPGAAQTLAREALGTLQSGTEAGGSGVTAETHALGRGVAEALLDLLERQLHTGEGPARAETSGIAVSVEKAAAGAVVRSQPLHPMGFGVRAPAGFGGGNDTDAGGGAGYTIRTACWKRFPFAVPALTAAEAIKTWYLSVRVFDLASRARVSKFQPGAPLRVVLPVAQEAFAYLDGNGAVAPVYFDETVQAWRDDGLTLVKVGDGALEGAPGKRLLTLDTTHTTYFAGRGGAAGVVGGVEGDDGGGGAGTTLVWVLALCALLLCCSLCAAYFVVTRMRKKKEREEEERARAEKQAAYAAEHEEYDSPAIELSGGVVKRNPILDTFPQADPDVSGGGDISLEGSSRSAGETASLRSPERTDMRNAKVIDVGDE